MSARTNDDPLQDQELVQLRSDIRARTAEAAWLKAHYGQRLLEASATIEALRATDHSGETLRPLSEPPLRSEPDETPQLLAQIEKLRAEVKRLQASERRYLDRIEELKETGANRRSVRSDA